MAEVNAGSPKAAGRRIRGLDAEQRRAQRREALLDAALELFASRGYPAVSIEQICQHAYVGTKSFYEVFDGKEAVYVALLERIVERVNGELESRAETAPEQESLAARMLIETFAHAFVDDVRIAQVTFGAGSAITPVAERKRRANRRWAAAFVEGLWQHYGVAGGPAQRHGIAIGVIGGLFDIIADWLIEADTEDGAAVEALVDDLFRFYSAVRSGMAGQ